MSLIPHERSMNIFEDPFFHHDLEPRFGHALLPSDLFSDRIVPRSGVHHLPTGYRRPWALARESVNELLNDQKHLHFGKEGFQACVDVHHFKPSEITVRCVGHTVFIEGEHEERDDNHGSISRHFVRKYVLPNEYDLNTVHPNLSSDGILTISAKPPMELTGERHIPITHTNIPAHLIIKKPDVAAK